MLLIVQPLWESCTSSRCGVKVSQGYVIIVVCSSCIALLRLCMSDLGPWSRCLQADFGPWSTPPGQGSSTTGTKGQAVAKAPAAQFGPWAASLGEGTAAGSTAAASQPKASAPAAAAPKRHGVKASAPAAAAPKRHGVKESRSHGDMGPWSQGVTKGARSQKRKGIDISAACLVDVPHHIRGHAAPVSKITEKAKDPKAIRERYQGIGRCVCAEHKARKGPPCHRKVPLAAVTRLCSALAGMSVEEKGFIFHHMYTVASGQSDVEEVEGSGHTKRLRWYIEDHKMCFTNFCHMLFTSPATVREFVNIEAGPDGKRISARHTGMPTKMSGRGPIGEQVDFFFQEYYQSAGEPLPQESQRTSSRSPGSDNMDADILQEVNGKWGPWLNKGDPLNRDDDDGYDPDRPVVDTSRMCTLACDGAVVGLPIRFVQHSTLWALYWQFLAHWDALKLAGRVEGKRQGVEESAPSFSTFQRRWQAVWRFYLRFRKSSAHAQCNTCFKLQMTMFARGSSVAERLDAARHQSQDTFHPTYSRHALAQA